MRFSSLLAAGAIAAACGPALAEEHSAWRLFVADHSKPLVSAIDLASGEVLETFALDGPAALYATSSQAAVFAVQADAGKVVPLRTGIGLDDHGDHGDIEVSAPALVDAPLMGERPVHFVEHEGDLAVFFDGEGVARVLREAEWLAGNVEVSAVAASAPHHGVAVQLGDYLMMSEPNPGDHTELPVGMQVIGPDRAPVGDLHECPELHGEASSGNLLAIACGTGLLLVKEAAGGPDVQFLPYAEGLPEGKTTTLLGGVGMQYFLGNFGASRVVLIDPAAPSAFRTIELPTRRVHFAVNPENVKLAYVFTEDGVLREIDVVAGKLTRQVKVTEPYSMDGEWSLPRPRIAVADGQVAVTDPLQGSIHIVDAESLEIERTLALGDAPYNIVAVGGSGRTH